MLVVVAAAASGFRRHERMDIFDDELGVVYHGLLFEFSLCRIVVARSFEKRVPSVTYPETMSVSASTCHLVEFRMNCLSSFCVNW